MATDQKLSHVCTECAASFSYPEKLAGQKVNCPKCNTGNYLPERNWMESISAKPIPAMIKRSKQSERLTWRAIFGRFSIGAGILSVASALFMKTSVGDYANASLMQAQSVFLQLGIGLLIVGVILLFVAKDSP